MKEVNTKIEALSGCFAGVCTEVIFYSLDSYKVMKQAGTKVSLNRLFNGLLPVLVTGSAPTFGIFFAVYENTKAYLLNSGIISSNPVVCASIASIIGGGISSLAGVPSDVIKKRVVLGDTSTSIVVKKILKTQGLGGFFLGWRANLVKDVPFAALKLTLYEGVWNVYLNHYLKEKTARPPCLSESAIVGFLSGAITGVVTCPLDVVNTKIKSGEYAEYSLIQAHVQVAKREGTVALFRGLGARVIILGFGSTIFWSLFAKCKETLNQIDRNLK